LELREFLGRLGRDLFGRDRRRDVAFIDVVFERGVDGWARLRVAEISDPVLLVRELDVGALAAVIGQIAAVLLERALADRKPAVVIDLDQPRAAASEIFSSLRRWT
jgi:hypothetical protein